MCLAKDRGCSHSDWVTLVAITSELCAFQLFATQGKHIYSVMGFTGGQYLWITTWFLVFSASTHRVSSENPECPPCVCQSESASVIANCTNRQLSQIPTSLPGDMTILDISGNSLDTVSSATLTRYPNLAVLIIANNNIKELPQAVFAGLPAFREVDFSGNTLDRLSYDEFEGASYTLKIIRGLAVNAIHADAFAMLGLVELHLRVNSATIPENLFDPLPLRSLHLQLPNCINLPLDGLGELTETLEELSLDAPMVDELYTRHLQALVRLTSLQLVANVNTVPTDFFHGDFNHDCSTLTEFQCAMIKANRMKQELRYISVSGVSSLTPEHFTNLVKLSSVKITHANTVPNSFPESVTTLNLSHNDLRELKPEYIKDSVTNFDVSWNQIRSIPSGIFANAAGITHLDLSFNNITDLDILAFVPVAEQLQVLNLRGNLFCPLSPSEISVLVKIPTLLLDEGCREVLAAVRSSSRSTSFSERLSPSDPFTTLAPTSTPGTTSVKRSPQSSTNKPPTAPPSTTLPSLYEGSTLTSTANPSTQTKKSSSARMTPIQNILRTASSTTESTTTSPNTRTGTNSMSTDDPAPVQPPTKPKRKGEEPLSRWLVALLAMILMVLVLIAVLLAVKIHRGYIVGRGESQRGGSESPDPVPSPVNPVPSPYKLPYGRGSVLKSEVQPRSRDVLNSESDRSHVSHSSPRPSPYKGYGYGRPSVMSSTSA